MRRQLFSCLLIVLGLLALPCTSRSVTDSTQRLRPDFYYRNDPRLAKLRTFFEKLDCPIDRLAADFLVAADRNKLDWRLLPSISVVESSGGKYFRNNNIFGWDSCRQAFPTVRYGIHHVASRLAKSKIYKNKDLDQLLETYNPEQDLYPRRVKSLMRALGPAKPPAE